MYIFAMSKQKVVGVSVLLLHPWNFVKPLMCKNNIYICYMGVKYIKKSRSKKSYKLVSYKKQNRTRRNRSRCNRSRRNKHLRGGWGSLNIYKHNKSGNSYMMGGWGMVLNNV